MAIIYSYQNNTDIQLTDIILGTSTVIVNGRPKNQTKSFSVQALVNKAQENLTGYVPYSGAILDLNLGNNSLFLVGDSWATSIIPYVGIVINSGSANTQQTSMSLSAFNTETYTTAELNYDGSLYLKSRRILLDVTANLRSDLLSTTRAYQLPDEDGTIALKTAASGSFTSSNGKTITVVNGIITSIVNT